MPGHKGCGVLKLDELICAELNNMITNYGRGNPELANLPRKINIALSPSRDDFPHIFINDVGLQALQHPETGEVRLCRTASACRDSLLSSLSVRHARRCACPVLSNSHKPGL